MKLGCLLFGGLVVFLREEIPFHRRAAATEKGLCCVLCALCFVLCALCFVAPDSGKDREEFEKFVEVTTFCVMSEGIRRETSVLRVTSTLGWGCFSQVMKVTRSSPNCLAHRAGKSTGLTQVVSRN